MPTNQTAAQSAAVDERTPENFTISELAAEFGLTPRTIRFYEDENLLSPGRSGMSRVYSRRDRARLDLICRGKRLGFSLAEVKEFLDLYNCDQRQVEQMKYAAGLARQRIESLEVQLQDVKQTLADLHGIEKEMLDYLRDEGVELTTDQP